MKSRFATYLIVLACSIVMATDTVAAQRKLTYGIECGYASSFLTVEHANFFDPEDYSRVNARASRMTYKVNGEMFVHIGYNFNDNWNLSVYTGYAGVGEYHPSIPIFLRASRYFGNSTQNDRWFTFIDAGSGIGIKSEPQEIYLTRLGGGYRLSLSRMAKLDLMASLRCIYTHPELVHYGEIIPGEFINSNNAFITSLNIGIGLTF